MSESRMQSYSYYDDLRRDDPENVTPIFNGTGDSQHVGRNLHTYKNGTDDMIVLCHAPVFVRYTTSKEGDYSAAGYGAAAGAMLAVHHWNTGNDVVVKELKGIHETCPIRFTTEIFDTQSNAVPAVKGLTDMMIRSPDTPELPQPCAIVGTILSSVSTKFAITTGVYDLLQVAPGASSDDLDDKLQYPLFSRTHPADGGSALLLPKYLKDVLHVKNFAIVYIADDGFGLSYLKVVSEFAKANDMNMLSVPITFLPMPTKENIKEEMQVLQDAGLNYVLGIFFFDNYDLVMEAAGELGVAGPGRFWFFGGSLSDYIYENAPEFDKDSVLAKATYGSAIITDGGAARGTEQYGNFVQEWKQLGENKETLDYINSKQPNPPPGTNLTFGRSAEFFNKDPNHIAIYSYDGVIGIGLAACQAAKNANSTFVNNDIFNGAEHHAAFLDIDFLSASGKVVIGPTTYSRNETSTYFVVANIVESGDNKDPTKISLQGKDYSYFDPLDGDWKRFDSESPFIFSDGRTIQPSENPEVVESMHLISPSVRATCLTLCGIILATSFAFLIYTVKMRKKPTIRMSQPPFLMMICVGTIFMATAIIPLSMDEGVAGQRILDASCSMTYWFFSFGFTITFAALFSKLWRANRVRQLLPM